MRGLVKSSDVKIKYGCGADRLCYESAAEIVMEGHDYKPKFVQDFRKKLEDGQVDAVVIATSDRRHALGTIMNGVSGEKRHIRGKVVIRGPKDDKD